ncbi:ATP-binding protein [Antribacter gilvus]|uniref:ATP-binding protein n=1 Tax=Antribacter gilvus TaxID=2304675 RepID=UPI0013E0284F|nr:ATP-binding protein [Antribacter gilvus]
MFVGRDRELRALEHELETVRSGRRLDRGVAVMLRGRRRIGKSRLAAEFARRSGLPYVHFQASRRTSLTEEIESLARATSRSTLPSAQIAERLRASTLTEALENLATVLPDDQPSIVILDELPWLLEAATGGSGELQRVWDLHLSRKPVLLLLLGSDLGMMEQLTRPDQPFFGRATEMVLHALTPRDVSRMTETSGMDAFDAYLVTGGQPLVAQEWKPGTRLDTFLQESFGRATSALLVNGAQVLSSEFGNNSLERQVLTATGGRGERTFTSISSSPVIPESTTPATVTRMLTTLMDRRILAADEPLSARRSAKDRRYRIADPALQFWLAFVEASLPEVDAGRPEVALHRVRTGYGSWRGRAIEPVVRDAVFRLARETMPEVRVVGGWWPRTNVPEIDLVGADARPARSVELVGTIKWRGDRPISSGEVRTLFHDATSVPGVGPGTRSVGVCPAGAVPDVSLDKVWTADDLLAAWP